MDKPFLVVSDLHLGAVPRSTEAAFRAFLRHAANSASGLLINGDLFDFWFEYRTVIRAEHFRVLATLADVVESGLPVQLIAGNHDAWGGRFLREEVGIELLYGPLTMRLGCWRTRVVHGDGVGAGDLGYRILRRVIRSRLAVRAFRTLHPDWSDRVAGRASSTRARIEGGDRGHAGRGEQIEQWAREQLRSDATLDLVVAGHSHRPALVEVEAGRFYANSGDWLTHFTYLALPTTRGAAPELRRWPQ